MRLHELFMKGFSFAGTLWCMCDFSLFSKPLYVLQNLNLLLNFLSPVKYCFFFYRLLYSLTHWWKRIESSLQSRTWQNPGMLWGLPSLYFSVQSVKPFMSNNLHNSPRSLVDSEELNDLWSDGGWCFRPIMENKAILNPHTISITYVVKSNVRVEL